MVGNILPCHSLAVEVRTEAEQEVVYCDVSYFFQFVAMTTLHWVLFSSNLLWTPLWTSVRVHMSATDKCVNANMKGFRSSCGRVPDSYIMMLQMI